MRKYIQTPLVYRFAYLISLVLLGCGRSSPPTTPKVLNPQADVRLIYRGSVIPGGVRSVEEFVGLVNSDNRLRAEYQYWNLERTRIEKFTGMSYFYVAYERHGYYYWTKDKMVVPAGELLLTDGNNWARMRCGNLLSESPKFPTLAVQPELEEVVGTVTVPPAAGIVGSAPNYIPGAVATGISIYSPRLIFFSPPLLPVGGRPIVSTADLPITDLALGMVLLLFLLVRLERYLIRREDEAKNEG